jgi:hypothetical protein
MAQVGRLDILIRWKEICVYLWFFYSNFFMPIFMSDPMIMGSVLPGGGHIEMSSILAEPIAPSYMSPNAVGGRGVSGPQPMSIQLRTCSPNREIYCNSIFNLWVVGYHHHAILIRRVPKKYVLDLSCKTSSYISGGG